jgi:hypothetical protein
MSENTQNTLQSQSEDENKNQVLICKHCKDGIIPAHDYKCDTCGKAPVGGRRPNPGRKVGSHLPHTYEMMKVKEAFNQNVLRAANKLFNAQFQLAVGEQSLYVKRSVEGKDGKKSIIEIVDDPDIIKEYLVDDGKSINDTSENEYYYIATKPANNMAIDSLLNRALGKAPEKIQIEGGFFKAEKMEIEVVNPEIIEAEVIEDESNTDVS